MLDADEYLIGFPEGIDGSNSPYYNTFGLYGDRRYEYIWDIANSKSVNEEYTADAMSRPTKAVGYAYDTTRTSAQIANVDAIVTQYVRRWNPVRKATWTPPIRNSFRLWKPPASMTSSPTTRRSLMNGWPSSKTV